MSDGSSITYIEAWEKAVAAYGDYSGFFDSEHYPEVTLHLFGKDHRFLLRHFEDYHEKKKEFLQRDPFDPDLDALCKLCDAVAQAEETGKTLIADLGNYFVIPNKAPRDYGHGLFIVRNCNNGHEGERDLEPEDLEALIEFSDQHNLIAHRAHVLDGKSVPFHDHWHLLMGDSKPARFIYQELGELVQHQNFSDYLVSPDNPFDMIFMPVFPERTDAISKTVRICNAMNRRNQIYTVAYLPSREKSPGYLSISPSERNGRDFLWMGGIIPLKVISKLNKKTDLKKFLQSDKAYFEAHLPKALTFDWSPYIQER